METVANVRCVDNADSQSSVDGTKPPADDSLPNTVPFANSADVLSVEQLTEFILTKKKLVIISGAGVSTESNIPDYRSPGVGLYVRNNHRPTRYNKLMVLPTLHNEFMGNAEMRQRYWARNFVAWSDFMNSEINITHKFVAWLENVGKLHYLITQNVDGLHTASGTDRCVELHGCTQRVECMSCGAKYSRRALQPMMEKANPNWVDFRPQDIEDSTPDGDVNLLNVDYTTFQPPHCVNKHCQNDAGLGGILKPSIVFFGGNVPKEVVHFSYARVEEADGILILGSSMKVYSGWRFARHAAMNNIPIAIINIGETRADDIATLKVEARLGDVVKKVWHRLARTI
eukprot:CFRG5756T1